MATKVKDSSKQQSKPSVQVSETNLSSKSTTGQPSQQTIKSTTQPPARTKSRACRTVCPDCGSPKVPSASTCWGCYAKSKDSKTIELSCDCCGKKFTRQVTEHQKSLDRVGPNARVFCGRECYAKYKRENPLSYSKVKGVCAHCGEPLTGYSRTKFCSMKCYSDYREARRSTDEYSGDFQIKKTYVYNRDKTCVLCGVKKARKEAHHIDGDASNNDVRNLITLCPPCHRKYHVFTEPVRSILRDYFLLKTTS